MTPGNWITIGLFVVGIAAAAGAMQVKVEALEAVFRAEIQRIEWTQDIIIDAIKDMSDDADDLEDQCAACE